MTRARQRQAGAGLAVLCRTHGQARLQARAPPRDGARPLALPPVQRPARALQGAQIPQPAQAPAPVREPPRFRLVAHPRWRIRAYPAGLRPLRGAAGMRQLAVNRPASRRALPVPTRFRPRPAARLAPRMVGAAVHARGGRGTSAFRVPTPGEAWASESAAFRYSVLVREPSSVSHCPDWRQKQCEFIGWTLCGGFARIAG